MQALNYTYNGDPRSVTLTNGALIAAEREYRGKPVPPDAVERVIYAVYAQEKHNGRELEPFDEWIYATALDDDVTEIPTPAPHAGAQ